MGFFTGFLQSLHLAITNPKDVVHWKSLDFGIFKSNPPHVGFGNLRICELMHTSQIFSTRHINILWTNIWCEILNHPYKCLVSNCYSRGSEWVPHLLPSVPKCKNHFLLPMANRPIYVPQVNQLPVVSVGWATPHVTCHLVRHSSHLFGPSCPLCGLPLLNCVSSLDS